jgi:Tol biopolymer transport system component
VSHILRTRDQLETFPCWAPDGRRLYYCCADLRRRMDTNVSDSVLLMAVVGKHDSLYYDLYSVDFDPATRRFGTPRMEVDAAVHRKSLSVPRVSPDGRYVLYTQGNYGQFHIWHISADLWVKDLERDTCYALSAANSPDPDSFHSWSSNGRWIAFSSRRMDKNYTRPFIAYFDKNGQAHKAFAMPQRDPEYNQLLLKSYNVPELTREEVKISPEALRDCIYNTDGDLAKYLPGKGVGN